MPLIPLDDLNDSRLAVFRDLKLSNLTRDRPHFITEGEKLLRSLVSSRYPLRSVAVEERYAERIRSLVPREIPLFVLSTALIQALAGYRFHLGTLACGDRLPTRDAQTMLDEAIAPLAEGRCLLLALPHIDNPENLGAIIRTADVFGAAAVLTGPKSPDPLSRRVLRVSMGTSLRVPVIECEDLAAELYRLRRVHSFKSAAAIAGFDAQSIRDFPGEDRLVLLLGNETHGVAGEWTEGADYRLTIPMRPEADSLNVGAAAAIICYELCRER